MSELSLEAFGYTADEARVARRAYDLTTPPEQRARNASAVLAHADAPPWQVVPEPSPTPTVPIVTEKAA